MRPICEPNGHEILYGHAQEQRVDLNPQIVVRTLAHGSHRQAKGFKAITAANLRGSSC